MARLRYFLFLLALAGTALGADAPDPLGPLPIVPPQAVNAVLGAPLFREGPLWEEGDKEVAERLGCPIESRTADQTSYRLYPEGDAVLFGTHPYSVALYGRGGKADRLSIVFANRGDWFTAAGGDPAARQQEFAAALKQDAGTISGALTGLFGNPKQENFGASNLQEKVRRWDWNGHAFLLAAPRGVYVMLRVVSVAEADRFGRPDPVPGGRLRDLLAGRVERRGDGSGDVILRDVPMVDQGPKGYCGPATWERYLRYLEVPADMYVLAMAGGAGDGGGTYRAAMAEAADALARGRGLQILSSSEPLSLHFVARNIDQGIPLMWSCFGPRDMETKFYLRTEARKKVTDWDAYAREIAPDHVPFTLLPGAYGHERLIVGYNARTGELAISDSMGEILAERWITVEQAQAVSLGEFYTIKW